MRTAKETFSDVWHEWFGDEIDHDLNVILSDHDYIFEAMERYRALK